MQFNHKTFNKYLFHCSIAQLTNNFILYLNQCVKNNVDSFLSLYDQFLEKYKFYKLNLLYPRKKSVIM